jgi:HK97 family phage prohead protease
VDTITRSYTTDLTFEGRTIEGVVVPYEEPADVADDLGPTPIYREVFTPTSFARQLQGIAAGRLKVKAIGLNLDHRRELDRHIGYMAEATSTDAGLLGRFTLLERADIDLVRSMLAETHTGLSVECAVYKSRVRPDGVVERRTVELIGVAATPTPAYAGAAITAMRAADPDLPLPTPLLDAVAAEWGFTD